ncbi:hypothetical protein [Saccharopolyspora flava]|uniref:Uncharacterized protein n=1 Tax=Saccharopolyspora flava TaxID=95161 RepID=A0A1I6TJX2_9PSEU|nr:hypothetical protein [Saccharopolyspora flava]SFS89519.1 hypothetical protein SAMN05660874_04011 [Saccharopolyspora flava]
MSDQDDAPEEDAEQEDAEAVDSGQGDQDQDEGERLAERGEPEEGTPDRRLGLIADPDMPEQVTRRLADDLPELLGDEQHSWAVEVDVDPVTAGRRSTRDILASTRERMDEHSWDHAVCLTDLPVRADGKPVVAEADVDRGVAVVSLPALGGTGVYRRARQVVLQIVDELTGRRGGGDNRYGLDSGPARLLAPVLRRELDEDHEADVRYSTTRRRGRIRLLSGMVRSNQPAQLVFGLRSALAAAVATSAFGLSSSTIWQIGDQLGVVRQVIAAVVSVVLLVFWLISAHGLWEKPRRGGDREQVLLYNTSTVATLTIGVGVMYVGLFAINLAVALFIVPPNLLASSLGHPADFTRYLALAWGFTTMGVIAGALGSSLESDRAVRQAAYGYREEQRRNEQEH